MVLSWKQAKILLALDEDICWHFVVAIHHSEDIKDTRQLDVVVSHGPPHLLGPPKAMF